MVQVLKRRRGKSKPSACAFFQLNLDVLILIAEYLHPKDLLSLSRTCRSLRQLLMDASSTFVWKNARRQIDGLPDCPTDLTEQEYADLVFYARCHGCGKPARAVLWHIRRRYCPTCRLERLIDLSYCDIIFRQYEILPSEEFTIDKEFAKWVDASQVKLFLVEYLKSSDKHQWLDDKQKRRSAIHSHARECESWQQQQDRVRRRNLEQRRQQRGESIFERLKENGWNPEIVHFGKSRIRHSYRSVFRTSKPLKDKEWDVMHPEWSKIMDNFRSQRLDEVVYRPRRRTLAIAYRTYVTHHPASNTPVIDLVPHLIDLVGFAPFRETIKAPEGTQIGDEPFASAFAQLPVLLEELGWKRKLNNELAALVQIPASLSAGASGVLTVPSNDTTVPESSQTNTDKLHLACALFRAENGAFSHPEVFSMSMRWHHHLIFQNEKHWDRAGSIEKRFCVKFLEEAPYIVRACGLDPNVATADDMDRRNARLRCLWDDPESRNIVMNWRNAMWHISSRRHYYADPGESSGDGDGDGGPGTSPLVSGWQLVSDEHVDAIEAIEKSVEKLPTEYTRCLLCRPFVGDALGRYDFADHFIRCHGLEKGDIQRGVHYTPLGICDSPPVVEMVEEGDQVTYRVCQRYYHLRNALTGPVLLRRIPGFWYW